MVLVDAATKAARSTAPIRPTGSGAAPGGSTPSSRVIRVNPAFSATAATRETRRGVSNSSGEWAARRQAAGWAPSPSISTARCRAGLDKGCSFRDARELVTVRRRTGSARREARGHEETADRRGRQGSDVYGRTDGGGGAAVVDMPPGD